MALQSSGQISIKDIYKEVTQDEWGNKTDPTPNDSNALLYGMESLVNPNSTYKPGIAQSFARMTEWYGYDHHTIVARGVSIIFTNNTVNMVNCGIYGDFEYTGIGEYGVCNGMSSINLFSTSSIDYGLAQLTFEVENAAFPTELITDSATVIIYYSGTNKTPLDIITSISWVHNVAPATLIFRAGMWPLTSTVTIEIILGPLNTYY